MNEPLLMPHETVFSWVTRYHLCVGIAPERNTYQTLFGKEKVRIHAYLPCSIARLDKYGGISANQWLTEHTLYPLFQFFGHDDKAKLSRAMLTDKGNVISNAHIPHAKLNFNYGHKICPLCAQENLIRMGFAYYDIRYQIPGVEVCPIHACYLNYTLCGDYGVDRHLTLPKNFPIMECNNPLLLRFTQFCFDVLALSEASNAPESLSFIYRKVLSKKGFITKHLRIRMASLIDAISGFYRYFPLDTGWEGGNDFHFLGPLLREKSRTLCHPSKHLLFAFWLFDGDASQFNLISRLNSPKETIPSKVDADGNRVVSLVSRGLSMEQVSLQTGKSRCYIRRRCELAGVVHQTNNNGYDESVKHAVLIQAQIGRHRQDIADNLGVGIGYVEQVISNSVGLSQWRATLRVLKRVNVSSHELQQARILHPSWIRKELKAKHSKAFFCLYHHNRALLESILPAKTKPTVSPHDWSSEDDRLYQAISSLKDISSMSFTNITQSVRDRGHLRKNIDQLPKSRALLISLGKCN